MPKRATFLTLVVMGAAVGAQVFHTSTEHVSVSVIVTDRNDRPVTDLTQDDFVLKTNGREQKIADFAAVSIPPGNRAIDLGAPTRPAADVAANAATAESSRAFVFVIHDASIPPSELIPLKRLMTSVLRTLSPQDQVALIYTGRSDLSQDFTSDIDRLIDTVNDGRKVIGTPQFMAYSSLTTTLSSVVAALASSRHARRAVFLVGSSGCSLDAIADEWKYCRDLVDRAKRADVPFYVLDPRLFADAASSSMGIGSPEERTAAVQVGRDERSSMMSLAGATGGRAMSGAADPAAQAAEIVLENGHYYLLGFYPEPVLGDGKFHEINVTVKRPGLIVRARRGYVAPDGKPAKAMTATREMTGQLGAGLDDSGLSIRAFAAPLSAAPKGRTRTLVTIEISYPIPAGGDRTMDDDLRVGILALTPDSKIKASFQRPIKLSGRWLPGAHGKLVVNETIDLPTEQLVLRVGVTSRALGKAGTAHLAIEPPDFDDKKVQLSGLVIGVPTMAVDAALGLGSLRGIVPFQPTTSRVFTQADTLRVFSHVTWASKGATATVRVSIAGRDGLPVRELTIPGHGVSDGHYVGELDTALALASLSSGDYTLRVEAWESGKSALRQVPFVIR